MKRERNPGFVPSGKAAPHSAALHAGYGRHFTSLLL
jgi:hypothetical protein